MWGNLILLVCALSCATERIDNSTWEAVRQRRQSDQMCILPPYPKNGRYSVGGNTNVGPGEPVSSAQLNVSCNPGYQPRGNHILYCVLGSWSEELPQCVRFCKLDPHPSVTYRCQATNDESEDSYYRVCNSHEPTGTIVRPQCNEPNYHFTGVLRHMRCDNEGRWNNVAICQPECGTITPGGKTLIVDGREAKQGEFPWHAGIYRKSPTNDTLKMLICGGSLVSSSVVISAAHCFWDKVERSLHPVSLYAAALGKFYRRWNHPLDEDVQKFDVSNIKVPARYQGAASNFQDDIAAVWLAKPAVYAPHVRPICIDFEPYFDAFQLRDGNLGKVAGWGIKDLEGRPSPILQVIELPYVRIEQCIRESPANFQPFITSDKICAGYTNGSALCQGDSGGGLVFKAQDRVVERYYLRGIVSTAPESQEACNVFARTSFTKITKHKQFIEKNIEAVDQISANQQETIDEKLCILPPYPENGIYNTSGAPETRPGQSTHSVSLSVACNSGFKLDKDVRPSCANGIWTADIPKCIAVFCKLDPHPSVTYRCEVTNDGISSYFRECNKQEPAGTIVWPQCNEPNYHSTGTLASMRCFNEGLWTYIAICQPECGRVIPESSLLDSNQTRPRDQLNTDGRVATRGELPWHAGVYRKTTNPYMQICGGSLVSTNAVISAAHCFWSDVEKQLPASNYAIAVGKLYRPWNDLRDPGAQKSDVKDILIPTRYQGAATNFQDNIAIVLLTRTIEYSTHVRPVCLDFDISFERRQLQGGRLGKVAGWGLKGVDGEASPVLKVVDLPYVDIAECITDSPPGFREYITSDKICVGYRNGTALCKGDSGGGLVFPAESERGTERYYLRGVVSSAPACYTFPIAATQLLKHESFVKDYLSSIFY